MEPKKIIADGNNIFHCPKCDAAMSFVEAEPVRIIDGKLNMEDAQAHYFCNACNSVYRRLVNTEYYQWYKGPAKKVKDLEPTKLAKGTDGAYQCPLCGEALEFVEGKPVRVVDGKLYMDDSKGYYHCTKCNAIYRRLVNTDYYQWYDK